METMAHGGGTDRLRRRDVSDREVGHGPVGGQWIVLIVLEASVLFFLTDVLAGGRRLFGSATIWVLLLQGVLYPVLFVWVRRRGQARG